jgi:hydroxyacylglutathione hydrolase
VNDLAQVDANMAYWRLTDQPVVTVLLTHAHFDHCGNARALQECGAAIVAGPGDAEGIELGDERTIPYAYGRKFPACTVDVKVKDGDVVETAGLRFEVIHVPGHTAGCVFYRLVVDGRIVLFAGDVVQTGADSHTARLGWTGGVDYDRATYLNSLQRIARLEADVVLAGHYQPCLKEGYKLLQNAYLRGLMDLR